MVLCFKTVILLILGQRKGDHVGYADRHLRGGRHGHGHGTHHSNYLWTMVSVLFNDQNRLPIFAFWFCEIAMTEKNEGNRKISNRKIER